MESEKKKKIVRRNTRKTIAGIKLPPIESIQTGDIKTIIDVDPSFYSLVEGRPIRPDTSIQKYKHNIKEVALKRTLHGFLVDEILRIDKQMKMETEIFDTAFKHFDDYQKSFDKFLAHDNNKTIAIMKKSDMLAKDLTAQTEKFKKQKYELATLKSKLQYTEETLSILLSFQRFLYKASPVLWQEKQNIKIDDEIAVIFPVNSDVFSMIDIDLVKQKLSNLPPPKLFFETADQLPTVFNLLEKQNLHYLLATEDLNSVKSQFLKALDCLKDAVKQELDYIAQKIKETEVTIKLYEIRENDVKEIFYRILEEKLQYLVSSELALKLFNYIEFAYEKLIAPNDTKLSALKMAIALENEYDNLQLDISSFDLNMIKEIEKETYENSEMEIKQAKEAAKMLKNIDKLTKRMNSAYEPSRRKNK